MYPTVLTLLLSIFLFKSTSQIYVNYQEYTATTLVAQQICYRPLPEQCCLALDVLPPAGPISRFTATDVTFGLVAQTAENPLQLETYQSSYLDYGCARPMVNEYTSSSPSEFTKSFSHATGYSGALYYTTIPSLTSRDESAIEDPMPGPKYPDKIFWQGRVYSDRANPGGLVYRNRMGFEVRGQPVGRTRIFLSFFLLLLQECNG